MVHMKRRAAAIGGGSTSWSTIAFLLFLPSGAGSTEELARINHCIVWFHPIICYKYDIGFGVVFIRTLHLHLIYKNVEFSGQISWN